MNQPPDQASPASPDDLAARLGRAVDHHRSGRLADAERDYRAVLAADPSHPDALHLLGVLALQAGHPGPAVDLIEEAIRQAGGVADYHDNLGSALAALDRHAEAAQEHRMAAALNPLSARPRHNLGKGLFKPRRICIWRHHKECWQVETQIALADHVGIQDGKLLVAHGVLIQNWRCFLVLLQRLRWLALGKGAVDNIAEGVAFQQIRHSEGKPRLLVQPVHNTRCGNGIATQIKKVVLSGQRSVISKAIADNLKQSCPIKTVGINAGLRLRGIALRRTAAD